MTTLALKHAFWAGPLGGFKGLRPYAADPRPRPQTLTQTQTQSRRMWFHHLCGDGQASEQQASSKQTTDQHTEWGIAWLHRAVAWLHRGIACLHQAVAWLHRAVAWLHRAVAWLHRGIAWLHRAVAWLHRGIVMSCHVRRAMT